SYFCPAASLLACSWKKSTHLRSVGTSHFHSYSMAIGPLNPLSLSTLSISAALLSPVPQGTSWKPCEPSPGTRSLKCSDTTLSPYFFSPSTGSSSLRFQWPTSAQKPICFRSLISP